VESNLDQVGEVLSQQSQKLVAHSDELTLLKQQLQQLQQQTKKEREDEDLLQLANIYPSPSEDGAASEPGHRTILFPLSASSDDRQVDTSTNNSNRNSKTPPNQSM
jgi:hypothetical protein